MAARPPRRAWHRMNRWRRAWALAAAAAAAADLPAAPDRAARPHPEDEQARPARRRGPHSTADLRRPVATPGHAGSARSPAEPSRLAAADGRTVVASAAWRNAAPSTVSP